MWDDDDEPPPPEPRKGVVILVWALVLIGLCVLCCLGARQALRLIDLDVPAFL